jgi:hypothetical protein
VLLVIVQVPWNLGFAMQTWMGVPIGSPPAAIEIKAGETSVASSSTSGRSRQDNAKQAARALLQGDVDAAVEIQRSLGTHAAPVTLTVPLEIKGLSHDEFAVVDRAYFEILDARGAILYRGSRPERKSAPFNTDASGTALQTFEVPAADYRKIRARAVSVVVDYSLTVRAVVAQHRLRATGGELRSTEIGVCRSDADSSAAYVRCRQIGRAPNCYASTLYGPDGRHNPEVRACGSDYRPFIPAPMNIITLTGVEMPIRDSYGVAHYDVDGSQIQDSYIVLKVYETGEHFQRRVASRILAD